MFVKLANWIRNSDGFLFRSNVGVLPENLIMRRDFLSFRQIGSTDGNCEILNEKDTPRVIAFVFVLLMYRFSLNLNVNIVSFSFSVLVMFGQYKCI